MAICAARFSPKPRGRFEKRELTGSRCAPSGSGWASRARRSTAISPTSRRCWRAAVAREGFQAFSRDLSQAWTAAGGGRDGFRAMGAAYVKFAIANPSHYRVMFGAFKDLCERDAQLAADAQASFQVLLDAVVQL